MRDEGEQTPGRLAELLSRARSALSEHLHPSVAEALAMLDGATGPGAEGTRIAARLYLEPDTQAVMLRCYDSRTGETVREFSPAGVVDALAQVRPTITIND